jgi:hypothetical protein
LTVTWVEFGLLMSFYSSRYMCVLSLGRAEAIITWWVFLILNKWHFHFPFSANCQRWWNELCAYVFFFWGEGLLFSVSLFSEYNPRNELQLNEDVHGEIRSQERMYVCGQSDRAGQYIRKSKRRSSWLELEIHQRTLKNILRQGYKSRWGRAKQRGEIEKGFIPFSFPYIYITSEKKTTQ